MVASDTSSVKLETTGYTDGLTLVVYGVHGSNQVKLNSLEVIEALAQALSSYAQAEREAAQENDNANP